MTFQVKVRAKELFGFSMYHTYSGLMGKIWVLFSIFCLGAAVWTYGDVTMQGTIAMVFLGLLFTVINPLMLYGKCRKRAAKTPSYKEPFTYTFNRKGFLISQGDQSVQADWADLFQIAATRKAVYLCMDPIHAQIISLEQLGSQAEEVKEFLRTQVPDDIRKKGL